MVLCLVVYTYKQQALSGDFALYIRLVLACSHSGMRLGAGDALGGAMDGPAVEGVGSWGGNYLVASLAACCASLAYCLSTCLVRMVASPSTTVSASAWAWVGTGVGGGWDASGVGVGSVGGTRGVGALAGVCYCSIFFNTLWHLVLPSTSSNALMRLWAYYTLEARPRSVALPGSAVWLSLWLAPAKAVNLASTAACHSGISLSFTSCT